MRKTGKKKESKPFSQELQRVFAQQREKPGSAIAAPQITTNMCRVALTCSCPGAVVQRPARWPLTASWVGLGCFQAGWRLPGLLGTPLTCREPHLAALPAGGYVGDCTLPATSSSGQPGGKAAAGSSPAQLALP